MKNVFKNTIVTIAIILVAIATTSVNASAKTKLNTNKKTLTVGQTYTIKLNGNSKKAKWTSSNKKVAKITKSTKKSAKVKAVKNGKATIKVKVGNKTYKCTLTVKADNHSTECKHNWVTETIHHKARYHSEEHWVASDGFDFTAAGYTSDQIGEYCIEHGVCWYNQFVDVVVREAYDEVITKCSICGITK